MLRTLSQDVVVSFKDRLRGVRHLIREQRHDRVSQGVRSRSGHLTPLHRDELRRTLGHAANMVDDALTIAETVSFSLLPIELSSRATRFQSLLAYFPAHGVGRSRGELLFRRDMYRGAKEVLGRQAAGNARIREADFLAIHAAVRRKNEALLASLRQTLPAGRLGLTAALCASLLIEMLAAKPVRFEPSGATPAPADASMRCFAPLALACGIATLEPAEIDAEDILEAAMLAADARHDRISAALGGPRPVEELTRLFSLLLAHLP